MSSKDLTEHLNSIANFYKNYSLDDVLKSLFVVGSYPLNIASQIQHNFQYEALRGCSTKDFKNDDQIKDYEDFKRFCKELYKITPGFPTYEDYCPPIDWGDTQYFFDQELFSIIWGVDGSTYDQITEFRLIYTDNEDRYKKKVGRSPKGELKSLLELHTSLAVNVETGLEEVPDYVTPGTLEVPSKEFWQDILGFSLEHFETTYPTLAKEYVIAINELFESKFDEKEFLKRLSTGSTIDALFINTGDRYYPLFIRYSIENVIKRWKKEFTKYHRSADFFEDRNNARKDLTIRLSAYQQNKFGKKTTYYLPVLLNSDGEPEDDVLVSLTFVEDKILATLTASPANNGKDIEKELSEMLPRTWEALRRFKKENPKFYLPLDGKICELQPRYETGFQIEVLVVLPAQFIEPQSIKLPKTKSTTFMFLEDYLAIIDGCEDERDLLRFINYMANENIFYTDTLDLFGSYKDSDGVLVAGADEPTIAVVAPSWGPSYRYRELKEFWLLYPGMDILDDPRGWSITQETDTRLRLEKKSLFHSMLYSKYGQTHFLQSSPFMFQDYEAGSVTNLLMESLEDTLSRINDSFKDMPVIKYGHKAKIYYFPSAFLEQDKFKHLRHLATNGKMWNMDLGRYSSIGVGVRVVYDSDLVSKALQEARDNSFELGLAKEILIVLDSVYPDKESLERCLKAIDALKGKPRFTRYAVAKEASHPYHSKTLEPSESDYKKARKVTAFAAKRIGLTPGRYKAKTAQTALNEIISALRTELETAISKFSFDKSIVDLVGYVDAEIAKFRYKRLGVIGSKEHDVDYERDQMLAEAKKEFLFKHRNNRYLLEKFISMKPVGTEKLREDDTRFLMAIADEIIGAYSTSDSIHYDLYQPYLVVADDYQIGTTFPEEVLKQQEKFTRKQSQISLGQIGLESDRLDSDDVIKFADTLDGAFIKDFGFKLSSLLALQQVLALWSEYTKYEDSEAYSILRDEVVETCTKNIKGITKEEVEKIISFLTLEADKILTITDNDEPPLDVPVWEHIKRPYRYSIRPLIELNNKIVWGPYAVNMSLGFWSNVIHDTELPTKLDAPHTLNALKEEHVNLDKKLEQKCIEIGKRHTKHARSVERKHVKFPQEYGDYDCLLYLAGINTFVNVEAKNINMPKVTKDTRTQIEKVFLKEKKNYVYRVEQREKYLNDHYQDFASLFGVTINKKTSVISIFITTDIYFWTEYPPRETSVVFLRIDMLDDYLKQLLKQ